MQPTLEPLQTSHVDANINHNNIFKFAFASDDLRCTDCTKLIVDQHFHRFFDWNSLERCPIETVDQTLSSRSVDLGASVNLVIQGVTAPLRLVFAIEHKSEHNNAQIMRKLNDNLHRLSAQDDDALVMAAILYNGPRRKYAGPISYLNSRPPYQSLCAEPELKEYLSAHMPNFSPFYVNLHDPQVKQRFEYLNVESKLVFNVMASAWERDARKMDEVLREFILDCKRIEGTSKWLLQLVPVAVTYLNKYWKDYVTMSKIEMIEKSVLAPGERIMSEYMDAWDVLTEGYKEAGRTEGIELGAEGMQKSIAESLLLKGVDIQTICESTGLSEYQLRKLNGKSG